MEKAEQKLEKYDIRPTAMRLLVYEFIGNQKTAISLTVVKSHFEKSDRTTLYRTLKTFEEKGLVHQINDDTGIPKYALCKHDHQAGKHNDLHLHFHCTQCGDTVCLTNHQIPQISLPDKFTPENINMLVKGICDKCSGQ